MNTKLERLRALMQTYNLEAYIIPNTDPHQSEYVAEHWRSMTWVSGFDGSAGTLVVAREFAGLWTDVRYFIQGERQLKNTGVDLMKLKTQGVPEYLDWLAENLKEGDEVGFDGKLFSIAQVENIHKKLDSKGIHLVACDDLIKVVWDGRAEIPTNPIFVHNVEFAGKSRMEKIADVRSEMNENKVQYHLLTALDDIGWLLNIRGNDVECNPVAICYALITPQNVRLFINKNKVSEEIKNELKTDGVELFDYMAIESHLKALGTDDTILMSKGQVSHWLYNAAVNANIVYGKSIPHWHKAIKNEVEIQHFRTVMAKDGVAMVRFLKWLEDNIGKTEISELSASEKLTAFRAALPNYYGNSFDPISGYKGNGAIIHYRVTEETDEKMAADGVYLIDSGGQYLDGTTDITRTVTLGNVNEEEKRAYTAVLKAHIAVAMSNFPEGTTGSDLHAICKNHLWNEGLDYGHGTGHGVGFFMNVHEGPQRIGGGAGGRIPFQLGMVTSNEPGNYQEDKFGIRIENLIITVPSKYEGYLAFETITVCPIDTTLINKAMLTQSEINWLNDYHTMTFERISPLLEADEVSWLRKKTEAI
jgi:Xaa-Pro aminopeptidase